MIDVDTCVGCQLIDHHLPPFTKMQGDITRYFIDVPEQGHNEKYLSLGLYADIMRIFYCPVCGKEITDDIEIDNTEEEFEDE